MKIINIRVVWKLQVSEQLPQKTAKRGTFCKTCEITNRVSEQVHYVSKEIRTTWEFCQLLDEKCIASHKGYSEWLRYAKQNHWIKDEI
jgi:hypothetical protein